MTNKKAKIIKQTQPEPVFDLQPHDINALADASASFAGGNKLIARMVTTSPRRKKRLKLTYQFKIKLRGITRPPVRRCVLVPASFTFAGFHTVTQETFGQWNEHLYNFGDKPYSRVLTIAEVHDEDWSDTLDYNARAFTVGEFYGEKLDLKHKLCYVYDFGDDWIHNITLEDVIEELHPHASCTAGKGVCPKEDCGGPWGYENTKENGEIGDLKDFDLEAAKASVETIEPERYEPW